MELRTDEADVDPPRKQSGRLLVWAVIAVILVVGIVIALIHGPRLTPLLDTIQ